MALLTDKEIEQEALKRINARKAKEVEEAEEAMNAYKIEERIKLLELKEDNEAEELRMKEFLRTEREKVIASGNWIEIERCFPQWFGLPLSVSRSAINIRETLGWSETRPVLPEYQKEFDELRKLPQVQEWLIRDEENRKAKKAEEAEQKYQAMSTIEKLKCKFNPELDPRNNTSNFSTPKP